MKNFFFDNYRNYNDGSLIRDVIIERTVNLSTSTIVITELDGTSSWEPLTIFHILTLSTGDIMKIKCRVVEFDGGSFSKFVIKK